jgi:hypothetical protein
MNKETLEEVAEKYVEKFALSVRSARKLGFIDGAKWQTKRMFELVKEYNQMLIDTNVHEDHKEKSFKEWFEQFKKK